jgi:hypothetical protein
MPAEMGKQVAVALYVVAADTLKDATRILEPGTARSAHHEARPISEIGARQLLMVL